MTLISEFESHLPPDLRKTFLSLSTPTNIQVSLGSMPFIATGPRYG
jgi:hypothetical protein